MAGSKAALRMADRLTGGTLAERIGEYRKVRAPWRAIAEHLHEQFGVEATPDTLRAWALDLGVADGPTEPETSEAAQ